MNRVLVAVASTLVLSGSIASVAQAQTVPQASPFQIVTLAQNGYFQDQGIPSQNTLTAAYQSGQITAEDVVEAAVADHRVSEDVINDEFIQSVATYLDGLSDR